MTCHRAAICECLSLPFFHLLHLGDARVAVAFYWAVEFEMLQEYDPYNQAVELFKWKLEHEDDSRSTGGGATAAT